MIGDNTYIFVAAPFVLNFSSDIECSLSLTVEICLVRIFENLQSRRYNMGFAVNIELGICSLTPLSTIFQV